jgi:hypothetical protein
MNEARPPRRTLRSIGAVLAGVLAIIALSIGTDMLMNATGVFPALGQPMNDGLLLIAILYRTVYGAAGSYLAARLAPGRPMTHALLLGFIGLAVSILGAVATLGKGPAYGHEWYPLALVALAIPTAWLGGKLRVMQSSTRVTPPEIAEA